ncbi:MAG: LytTR family transcriptional regulator DNA-binding domain-containing protein, partial [Flavobacteriales bacterium]|nr:LytTR family transcriptional regulator DNA-binding domain-containing protein [Flavobacteriales bacterium]
LDHETIKITLFDKSHYMYNGTLDELASALGSDFFRANRQTIIHHKAVERAEEYFGRKLLIHTQPEVHSQITVAKANTKRFLDWLQSR